MRLAGILARHHRYHGGEFNKLGNYVIVRQADAHAWCEVWLEGHGWQRVDPTQMIAPIASQPDSLLPGNARRQDDPK